MHQMRNYSGVGFPVFSSKRVNTASDEGPIAGCVMEEFPSAADLSHVPVELQRIYAYSIHQPGTKDVQL